MNIFRIGVETCERSIDRDRTLQGMVSIAYVEFLMTYLNALPSPTSSSESPALLTALLTCCEGAAELERELTAEVVCDDIRDLAFLLKVLLPSSARLRKSRMM